MSCALPPTSSSALTRHGPLSRLSSGVPCIRYTAEQLALVVRFSCRVLPNATMLFPLSVSGLSDAARAPSVLEFDGRIAHLIRWQGFWANWAFLFRTLVTPVTMLKVPCNAWLPFYRDGPRLDDVFRQRPWYLHYLSRNLMSRHRPVGTMASKLGEALSQLTPTRG